VLILETRVIEDPFGQLGISLGLWNFKRAPRSATVSGGPRLDTGARENAHEIHRHPSIAPQTNGDGTPVLNPNCGYHLADGVTLDPARCAVNTGTQYGSGTGKLAAISAEYDTSLARILWHPRNFDGRGLTCASPLRASFTRRWRPTTPLHKRHRLLRRSGD